MFLDKDFDLTEKIKTMTDEELNLLCEELREKLIENVSKTGGHVSSNLGAVELSVALEKVFDTSKDRVIWDVGHQTYIWKMLTGRLDKMDTIRHFGGLSGFPKLAESIHDTYDSGHASTSISAALGYAKARDLNGEDYACVAVIGDGAMTGGVAYEGLNMAGDSKTPLIVVLNDNQMSICPNIGGITKHLQKLRVSDRYLGFKDRIKAIVGDNTKAYIRLKRLKDWIKSWLVPDTIFEQFGFKYYGPIDGHNVKAITQALLAAKKQNRPVLVHIMTKKGKGYVNAEKDPSKFHGIAPFDPLTGNTEKPSGKSYSEIFGMELERLASLDDKIVAISAAMVDATGLEIMQKSFPARVFDVGIAEQTAVSFAAGLALGGMKPFVAIYSTFLQRAYDQVLSEVCLMNLPVIFAVDRGGITGRDGETHQGAFDLSYLSSMPNMTVLCPKDGKELRKMMQYAFTVDGPVAIRYPREDDSKLSQVSDTPLESGVELLTEDGTYAVLAFGSMVKEALGAVDLLNKNDINACVYNMRVVKPLNREFLDSIKDKYEKIAVIEDGTAIGGAGSMIASYLAEFPDSPEVLCIGWPDRFIEHGSISELRDKYGMNSKGIAQRLEKFF